VYLTLAILAAILVSLIQMLLYEAGLLRGISYIDYSEYSYISVGVILGFGALFGDLAKSFVKRRLNRKDGARFVPWDQLDYVLGIVVFSILIRPMSLFMVVILLVLGPFLSMLATRLGYALKLREEKW